jgi:hypothetical protein
MSDTDDRMRSLILTVQKKASAICTKRMDNPDEIIHTVNGIYSKRETTIFSLKDEVQLQYADRGA